MVEGEEGWKEREVGGVLVGRLSVAGRWFSMTWSRSPERKETNNKQEARTRRTGLNYRAET